MRAVSDATALIAELSQRYPGQVSTTPPDRNVTDVNPLLQIDDGLLMNQLPIWAPDPAVRKAILADNPARLYRF